LKRALLSNHFHEEFVECRQELSDCLEDLRGDMTLHMFMTSTSLPSAAGWAQEDQADSTVDMASLSEDISRVAGSQQRLEQQLAQQHMGIGEFLRELERNGVTASMLQDAMGRVEDKVDNISVQISRIEGAQINIQEEMAKNLELLMKIESEKSSLGRKSGISKRNTMMEKMPAMTIPYNAITIRQEVGHGGFGIVHKAIWEGNTVAYKELSIDNVTKRILKQLYSEAYVMNLLRHPNICGFFGIVLDKPHYGLVMNFYNGGSLDEILQDDDIDLPSQVYIPMARSMASAMLHLHSSKPLVLHGDLKSRNVLLAKPYDPNSGEIPVCILCDFGLSKVKSDSSTMASTVGTTQSGRGGGTLNWTPPELMNGGAHSKASDVYTFGMVLYELVARQYPFLGMQDVVVMNSITQGRRPDIPNDCPSDFAQLIQDCWKQNPTQRPAFDEIKRRLDQMGAERYEEVIELKPSSFERDPLAAAHLEASSALYDQGEVRAHNANRRTAKEHNLATHTNVDKCSPPNSLAMVQTSAPSSKAEVGYLSKSDELTKQMFEKYA
ncbi:hypothetical protein CYMTET_36681, partial [Cymbomonas tetramitiformis]